MLLKYLTSDIKRRIKEEYHYYKLNKRYPSCTLIRPYTVVSPKNLKLGKNVMIKKYCFLHCGGKEWSAYKGIIEVGEGCWFSEFNVLYGAGGIKIGKYTGTGPNVSIYSSRDNYSAEFAQLDHIVHKFEEVNIGSYVRIFSNVVIAPGVTIGEGAVIGAGSIVTKDIPPWTIAYGAPAKVVKKRENNID